MDEIKEAEYEEVTSLVKPEISLDLEIKLPEIEPIEHNLNVLEDSIKELNKFYQDTIFTEDSVEDTEKELTKLRSLINTMENNRKETITEYKIPIDSFEKTSKNIEKLLKDSIDIISNKIKVFKDAKKDEKTLEINNFIKCVLVTYIELYPNMDNILSEKNIVFVERWYNKTYKDSQLNKDIITQLDEKRLQIEKKDKDIKLIKDMLETIANDKLNIEKYIMQYNYTNDLSVVLETIKSDNLLSSASINIVTTNDSIVQKVDINEVDPFMQIIKDNTVSITFKGTREQIEKLEEYAFSLGLSKEEN